MPSDGEVGAASMASTSKVRLVVGLFGTPEEFAAALVKLRAQGLRPAQVNLVAQADALQGALREWSADEVGFANWIVCRPVDGTVRWAFAAAGEAAPTTAEQDAQALLGFRQWALRRQAQQLHRHLQEGGALLVVEPATDAEERAACTALLRHASGGVQTHEITRPPER
jgi:hypothetical protein